MAGVHQDRHFCDTPSEMEEEEREEKYQPSLCFLDFPVFRHAHHGIVERSLLHHHHHVGGSHQHVNGGPTARACLWPGGVIGANDDRHSSKGLAAPSRLKQAFFLITRRLNSGGSSAPPARRTAQFLYNPQTYAFNFETEGGSGRFVDFAQRFAPPEKMKMKEETPMDSQVAGLVQLL